MSDSKKPSIMYIITQGEFGGAQHYILDLAKSFNKDYEVSVVFGETAKSQKFIEQLDKNNIKFYVVDELKRELSLKDDFKAYRVIRKIIKAKKPSIVHLNSSKISILGTLAALGSGRRIVYTAHGWVFNEKLDFPKKLFYILAEKFTAFFKDAIINVSEFDKQSAVNYRIAPPKKMHVVHNGVSDFEILSQNDAKNIIASKLNEAEIFTKHDLIIGSIGFLYKNKGYEYLINAIKILVNAGLNPLLIIIGGGPEKDELENWVEQLNLHKNVRILGETDNASQLLRAFDLYVCSSIKEGFSYTIIEAMTAALPIVATKVGGNPELITDLKEGLICEPGDAEALAKTIIEMIKNPERSDDFRKAAFTKATSNFKVETMIQNTGYIYRSLIK